MFCKFLKKAYFVSVISWKEHHIKAKIYLSQKVRLVRGKWSDVVFTDEKQWNLDAPDGYIAIGTT